MIVSKIGSVYNGNSKDMRCLYDMLTFLKNFVSDTFPRTKGMRQCVLKSDQAVSFL